MPLIGIPTLTVIMCITMLQSDDQVNRTFIIGSYAGSFAYLAGWL